MLRSATIAPRVRSCASATTRSRARIPSRDVRYVCASARGAIRAVRAVAGDAPASAREGDDYFATIEIDTSSDDAYTIISIRDAPNKPGTLRVISTALADLGLNIEKAVVDASDSGLKVSDCFYVTDADGGKVVDAADVENIKICLTMILKAHFSHGSDFARPDGQDDRRSVAQGGGDEERRQHSLLYSLMDRYLKNDVMSVQESIVNHVEYTMARNRYQFDDFEAYQAASFSVRDRLIESWNDTQQHFRDKSPKRVYYLSMEFLMGRSLLNSLHNFRSTATARVQARDFG
jgi:glycogen phosphorylase